MLFASEVNDFGDVSDGDYSSDSSLEDSATNRKSGATYMNSTLLRNTRALDYDDELGSDDDDTRRTPTSTK